MIKLVGNSLGEGAYFSLDGHITFIFAGLFSIISCSISCFSSLVGVADTVVFSNDLKRRDGTPHGGLEFGLLTLLGGMLIS